VGYNRGTVKIISNYASITSLNGPVGGIVGGTEDSYGNVNVLDSLSNWGVIKGKTDVGGVLGFVDRMKLSHSKNYGLVEGEKYTGGIGVVLNQLLSMLLIWLIMVKLLGG
jgi:hypothetical protein